MSLRNTAIGCLLLLLLAHTGCIKRDATGTEEAPIQPVANEPALPAADVAALPRTALLGPRGPAEFELQGAKEKVDVSFVPVEGQPFKQALRATVKEASNSDWTVQVQARTAAPVEKGDALLATFYVRVVKPQEDGEAETQFVFEQSSEPYTKSVTYPLALGAEWRKVQVRFSSIGAYAPGQAQMIFRLGYEPEVIEIGGVTVENFGKAVRAMQLPNTEVADLKFKQRPLPKEAPLPPVEAGELAFDVTPSKLITKISPYVYGINSQAPDATRTTLRRMGGNRGTVYNWELNVSNAGNDYRHQNDDWSCTNLGYRNCNEPAGQYVSFVAENSKAGIDSIVVVPLIDWVSADKAGPVSENEKAPSRRFVRSYGQKPSGYAASPDRNDQAVYQDEFVNYLVQKFGRADKGGIKFYALDNEPALWHTTHPRVHPERVTYQEIVTRTETLAASITRIDPSAQVLGAVAFGWSEFMSLSSASDSKANNAKYGTYLDFFLATMKALEQKHGRRLVHVLDVHWYPEIKGNKRITEDDTTRKTVDARLEAPRSLWDPEYRERSWIGDQWQKPIRLFPWLKERVAERYPGTKIALTEYNFGTGNHISGGLAQIDVLGILGREGVYIANYWGNGAGVGDLPNFITAAFKIFRNYDGKGGQFGDSAVAASVQDIGEASVYAATRADGRLTVLVINKDQQKNFTGKIKIAGAPNFASATPYQLDASSATIRALPKVAIRNNVLSHELPRLSATLFVCDPG